MEESPGEPPAAQPQEQPVETQPPAHAKKGVRRAVDDTENGSPAPTAKRTKKDVAPAANDGRKNVGNGNNNGVNGSNKGGAKKLTESATADLIYKKMLALKLTLATASLNETEVLQKVESESSWAWLNTGRMLSGLREAREGIERVKKSTSIWKIWCAPNFRKDARKSFSDSQWLAENEAVEKMVQMITNLDSAANTVREHYRLDKSTKAEPVP